MLIGGALVNALAFTGSSCMFSRLSKDSVDAERKRHDSQVNDTIKQNRTASKGAGRMGTEITRMNGLYQYAAQVGMES